MHVRGGKMDGRKKVPLCFGSYCASFFQKGFSMRHLKKWQVNLS